MSVTRDDVGEDRPPGLGGRGAMLLTYMLTRGGRGSKSQNLADIMYERSLCGS